MDKYLQIKKEYLSVDELNPRILSCGLFQPERLGMKEGKLNHRYVYDYELEYFLGGTGSIVVDGIDYPVRKGDIMFRRPGSQAQGILPYSCYVIIIDLKGSTKKKPTGYKLEKPQDFQPYYINEYLDNIPVLSHPQPHEKYFPLFDSTLKEFVNGTGISQWVIKSNILQILSQLYQDNRNPFSTINKNLSPHAKTIRRVLAFIDRNISQKLKLEDMARYAHMSPSYFHSIFTDIMGATPNEYITRIRMERSKELLVKSDLPIGKIAEKCGFDNIPYFSYLFKKQNSITPGQFRRRHQLYS